jgi:erythromycin esterase
MGYDVIAFESSLSECDIANARVGSYPPLEVMRACIFATWFSSETLGLFEYLDAVRATPHALDLAGFDVQTSGQARKEASARLVRQVARVDAGLAQAIKGYEERLVPPLSPDDALDMQAAYAAAAARLARERDALAKLESRPLDVDFAIQEARSRVRYVGQLAASRQPDSSRIRDEGMADNLDFLLDRAFPGRKVIVWAHNFHVEKRRAESAPRAMGAWVAERRGPEVYTLGLFMGRGVATWNNRARYEIVDPVPDSLEAVLASAGWKMSLVDFTQAPTASGSWMRTPIAARDWGVQPLTITPALSFDGVIYIDTVTPPEYL